MTTAEKLDRRRKRSSSSSGGEEDSSPATSKTKSTVTAIFAIVFILSIINIDDSSTTIQQQRRYLAAVNSDEEDNVWARRQLRARNNNRGRNKERKLIGEIDPNLSDAAVEDGLTIAQPSMMTKRMLAKPPDQYPDRYHFEGCKGKQVTECQTIVDNEVKGKPEKFNGKQTLKLDIRKIREQTDISYHKVVLRTDETGQSVVGIFEDGEVYYPWDWNGNTIGPWSCQDPASTPENPTFLSPAECCEIIQLDIDYPDANGNYLACFVEEPVGGPNNPKNEDRAICVVDGAGTVVRACIHH